MSESTVQLDIPLLLPEIEDSRDACVAHLESTLVNRTGILHVHVRHEDEPAQLCLHYDPNLVHAADLGRSVRRRHHHRLVRTAGKRQRALQDNGLHPESRFTVGRGSGGGHLRTRRASRDRLLRAS